LEVPLSELNYEINMSTISSVNSTTDPSPAANQNGFAQIAKNFQAIGSALEAGNLSSAQTALAAFQKSLPGGSPSNSQTATDQPFGKNSQANAAYQNLTSALQSGNLSTAQQAFSSLQNDLKSAAASSTQSAHKGHHHHRSSSATDSTAAAATTTSTDTSSTGKTSDSTASSSVASDGSLNVFA